MILFASTIVLSAFLLFLVQPVIAKQILPWFGGSSAVWTTCMVFFQCALLAGYLYADTLVRRLSANWQWRVHSVMLVLSLISLPIVAAQGFKPTGTEEPIGRILLLLAATIGLPYLLLSTTGPLVQAWFARRYPDAQVYRLYALSNVASMGALIAYPPLIEPLTTVKVQAWAWSALYGVFVILALACAWRSRQAVAADAPASDDLAPKASNAAGVATGPSLAQHGLWLLLAALGSVTLLTVTTHITQNVASVPFLWVLPLVLYLTTFILCFDGQGWYRRGWMAPLAALAAVAMLAGLSWDVNRVSTFPWVEPERQILDVTRAVPLYALGLFLVCMFCHGELVARKPQATHLTRFYLMVSLGGALGGLWVGLVAPVVYDWTWEFAQALVLVSLLVMGLAAVRRAWWSAAWAAGCVVATGALYVDYDRYTRDGATAMARNFYGTLRVTTSGEAGTESERWRLMHGVIIHGEQYRAEDRRALATTYYSESSGIGRTLLALRALKPQEPHRVGLIGLGVGTLATYGRPADHYRIYEINPLVVQWAREKFTYLQDSAAEVVTPLGDARLVLEAEPAQRLDVLAIDAFSSDSIPVHLITVQAMQAYRRHVTDGGAIVFHITNRYLNLQGVVRQLADAVGWQAILVEDYPGSDTVGYGSDWVVITANPALLKALQMDAVGKVLGSTRHQPPWSDDFNNLFEVLK